MKKLVKFTFLGIILCLFMSKVDALSVSKNSLTIDKGGNDKVELYVTSDIEINSVEFKLVYMTNDVRADFIVDSKYSDWKPNGITHKVSLGESKIGKILLGNVVINVVGNPEGNSGAINIHSAKGYTANGDSVALDSQNINVTIGTPVNNQETVEEKKEETKEEPKTMDNNLLDKIESKLVKIELKKDVFEYTVSIDKDIKELDLKAIPKDSNTKVEISNQKIEEIKDNKIIITASNNDVKEEYIINLKEKEDIEVTIDKNEFIENGSYKSKWIVAAIVLVVILIVGLFLSKKK